jgi:hypothetical protein
METLEKLFLSFLTLFGMFILFLFGLYFDLGEMLASNFHREERQNTGSGVTDHLIDGAEERGRTKEIMPTALQAPGAVTSDDSLDINEMMKASMRYNNRTLPPPTTKELMGTKRAQLVAQGVTREEVLELEALGVDCEDRNVKLAEARRAAAEKRWDDAARILGEGIANTNPKNLLALRDYHQFLVQLYYDAKQIDKGREAARKLWDILDRIIMIRGLDNARPDYIQKEQAQLKAEKERLDLLYQEMEKRQAETGSPVGLTAAEKSQIKEAITKAHTEGKMSDDEYQRALRDLES